MPTDFTPFRSRGTRVYFMGGGFDVSGCPEPEALAAFITERCNSSPIESPSLLNEYGHEAHCNLMFLATMNTEDDHCDCAASKVEIFHDWPACNPGCDYEDPIGGIHDNRNKNCSCEAAKASIAKQTKDQTTNKASFSDHLRWVKAAGRRGHGADEVAIANMKAWHDATIESALLAQKKRADYADAVVQACQDFRQDVLTGIDGLDNDQINAVLHLFDQYIT